MTNAQIRRMIPKEKQAAIYDLYQDVDGIWIVLREGWNADGMDYSCRTIHCGGDDETPEATVKDLEYQISLIRKL